MIVQEYPIYNKPDLDKPLSLQVITKRKQLNQQTRIYPWWGCW